MAIEVPLRIVNVTLLLLSAAAHLAFDAAKRGIKDESLCLRKVSVLYVDAVRCISRSDVDVTANPSIIVWCRRACKA